MPCPRGKTAAATRRPTPVGGRPWAPRWSSYEGARAHERLCVHIAPRRGRGLLRRRPRASPAAPARRLRVVRARGRGCADGPRPRGRARGVGLPAVVPRRRSRRRVRASQLARRDRRRDAGGGLLGPRSRRARPRGAPVAVTAADVGFDLTLTEEQELAQRTAREFATEKVLPLAAEIDAKAAGPKALLAEIASLRVLGISVPARM